MAKAGTDLTTKTATAAIRNLPSGEDVLIPLYFANRTALEAMQGILNQPRVGNDASAAIQERMDGLDDEMAAIVAKLGRLSSVDAFWADSYAEVLVSHAFFIGKESTGALQALAKASSVVVAKSKTTH